MIVEEFNISGVIEKVKEHTDALKALGFLTVLLELCNRQFDDVDFNGGHPEKEALYQRGITEGYKRAIFDMFYYRERIVKDVVRSSTPKADFGAVERLLVNNFISEEEANAIRNGKIKQ